MKKPFVLFILGCLFIVSSSLLRYIVTKDIRVDYNELWGIWEVLAFVLFYAGLGISIYTYYNIIVNNNGFKLSPQEVKKLGLGIGFLSSFMMPMLAADIFTYMTEGNLATKSIFTYTDGSLLNRSDFFDYLSPHWQDCPNHYGPPLLFLFYLSALLGKTMLGSIIVFKVIIFIFCIVFVNAVSAYYKKYPSKKFNMQALLILAPVYWLEGIGQMHVDSILATFIMIALFQLRQRNWVLAALCLSIVVTSKTLYAVLLAPFIALYIFFAHFNDRKLEGGAFLKAFVLCVGILFLIAFSSYKPVWDGIETITTSINYHEGKNPSRSFTEVFTDLIIHPVMFFKSSLGEIQSSAAAHENDLTEAKKAYWSVFIPFFKILAFLMAISTFLTILKIKHPKQLFHIFAKLFIIVICFYSPIFHPWYFIIVLPFLVETEIKSWIYYAVFVFSLSSLHEITYSIQPDSYLHILVFLSLLFMVISFLFYFRKHFITEVLEAFKN